MPTARRCIASEGNTSLAVDVYDAATGTWLTGPELPGGPMKGFGCSATACDGRLYVSGMKGALYRLSTGGHAWEPAGELEHPRFFLVPTGQLGEVRVFFRGQPLGEVTAALHTPDGKERALKADGEGYLRFHSEQAGLHHLSIGRHRESLGGFHGGLAYETTSHNAALTWTQP